MTYDLVLFTGQSPSNLFFCRFAGPHRLATEARERGLSTKVINGLGHYSFSELRGIVDKFIGPKTTLGFSTTFLLEYSSRFSNVKELYDANRAMENIDSLVEYYKIKYPSIRVVFGGPSCTKKKLKYVPDLYVEGYGEKFLTAFALRKKLWVPQRFHKTVPYEVNAYDEGFDFKNSTIKYKDEDGIFQGDTLPLEISRGCIFNCKFCSYPLKGRGKGTDYIKDPQILRNELLENYEKFGVTKYTFVDDTFNDSPAKLDEISNIVRGLPFNIEFAAYLRADLLHAFPHTISQLREMGLRAAFFGVETLHEPVKKVIGKGLAVDKTLGIIDRVNKEWGNDVVITSSFIYGLPEETEQTMQQWTDDHVFGSGIFDRHDLIFQPLFLLGKNATYKTDFDLDLARYGYSKDENSLNWTNGATSFERVREMSIATNNRAAQTPRPVGNFYLLSLMGYGLTFEEASRLNINDEADLKFIVELTKKRFADYKELVNDQTGN